jgi:3-phytase
LIWQNKERHFPSKKPGYSTAGLIFGMIMKKLLLLLCLGTLAACEQRTSPDALTPTVITEKVIGDSDDPAIWIDSLHPENSLVLGSDKDEDNGGLYVFDLNGKIDRKRTKTGLKRVNNVDVGYGFKWNGQRIDIAVCTERNRDRIRVYRLPDMTEIDGGGLPVFEGEAVRAPMGVALYLRPSDSSLFAIVGRKAGPREGYLAQYLLQQDTTGTLRAKLVRMFGNYSGKKEIESIAVDQELGYVYYSDEQYGVRKYHANPDKGNQELAVFGQDEFLEDNEGISIYATGPGKGYILVSDQSNFSFNVYPREGVSGNPHTHQRVGVIDVKARNSDGSDVTANPLPGFPKGLFVVMSDDKTFHYYQMN